VQAIQSQAIEECKQLREQLDTVASTPAMATYAAVVNRQPSHQQDTQLVPLARPTLANTLFCTIDTSWVGEEDKGKTQIANIRQQIEKEMRGNEDIQNWRCAVIVKDPKNTDWVKVICRHEEEI
jgi:hypothetical protein